MLSTLYDRFPWSSCWILLPQDAVQINFRRTFSDKLPIQPSRKPKGAAHLVCLKFHCKELQGK